MSQQRCLLFITAGGARAQHACRAQHHDMSPAFASPCPPSTPAQLAEGCKLPFIRPHAAGAALLQTLPPPPPSPDAGPDHQPHNHCKQAQGAPARPVGCMSEELAASCCW